MQACDERSGMVVEETAGLLDHQSPSWGAVEQDLRVSSVSLCTGQQIRLYLFMGTCMCERCQSSDENKKFLAVACVCVWGSQPPLTLRNIFWGEMRKWSRDELWTDFEIQAWLGCGGKQMATEYSNRISFFLRCEKMTTYLWIIAF